MAPTAPEGCQRGTWTGALASGATPPPWCEGSTAHTRPPMLTHTLCLRPWAPARERLHSAFLSRTWAPLWGATTPTCSRSTTGAWSTLLWSFGPLQPWATMTTFGTSSSTRTGPSKARSRPRGTRARPFSMVMVWDTAIGFGSTRWVRYAPIYSTTKWTWMWEVGLGLVSPLCPPWVLWEFPNLTFFGSYRDFSFCTWGTMLCWHRAASLLFLERWKAVVSQGEVPLPSLAVAPKCHSELRLPELGNAGTAVCPAPARNGRGSFPLLPRETDPAQPCPIGLHTSGALQSLWFFFPPCPAPVLSPKWLSESVKLVCWDVVSSSHSCSLQLCRAVPAAHLRVGQAAALSVGLRHSRRMLGWWPALRSGLCCVLPGVTRVALLTAATGPSAAIF